MNLRALNTRAVGYAGLAGGAGMILASVGAFFKLLEQPTYLVSLYWAISHAKHHIATQADALVIAQLVAALVAMAGAFTLFLLAAYLGRPRTV